MRDVLLHAGQPKTGSSYIQAFFALNAGELSARGIHYPETPSVAQARDGGIASGNHAGFRQAYTALDATAGPDTALLLSSEELFGRIAERGGPLPWFAEKGARVRILLFVRDPLTFRLSNYGQGVKRHGQTRTLDEVLRDQQRASFPLVPFVEVCDRWGADLRLEIYNHVRHRLLEVVCDFLGTSGDGLARPSAAIVNRSLAPNELEFLRQINRVFGRQAGRRMADRLCIELPDVTSGHACASRAALEHFARLVRPQVEAFEARYAGRFPPLGVDWEALVEAHEVDGPAQTEPFTEAQARIVREELLRLGAPAPSLAHRALRGALRRARRALAPGRAAARGGR